MIDKNRKMTFVIITHVPHILEKESYFAYGPYVKEMNIWSEFVDKIVIVSPQDFSKKTAIDQVYVHNNIEFSIIENFNILSLKGVLDAVLKMPKISWKIFKAMREGDHIHLRCPGNIGLIGSIIQIFFPNKLKTAKYAGNWDPKSKQPLSYRIQKWILSNTFLTRNMQVLVYGNWENQTKNIKPFFTATYSENEKKDIEPKSLSGIVKFVYAGALVKGKNPLYTVQLIEALYRLGCTIHLDMYGEGTERQILESYLREKELESIISLHGNQSSTVLQSVYESSHFLVLASESEGWPKVVAEAMFWGCLPLVTKVSCVPDMLDYGNRGVLLSENLEKDITNLTALLDNQELYDAKIKNAINWSRNYTIDNFENEIKLLLKG